MNISPSGETCTMKRFATILLLLLAASLQAQSFSFGNETLTYSVRHNLFPGTIGTMTYQTRDAGDNWQVDATLKASVGGFYTLDCTYGSIFRKDEALTPVSATRSQTEKKYWAKGSYEWLAPGQVHMDITKSSRPHRDEVLEWAGTVRDLLGMIWWLRTLDYDQAGLRPGPNALLIDHDALPVTIASYQKKTFKYKGQSVPVIEVTLSQEGKEALHLTLSDDERRQPLRFSIGLPFGTIKGTLK